MRLTGAQIIAQVLIEQGVDTVFGYPGGTVLNIFDALYDRSEEIRLIIPSHEQGGIHAADGYARVSGRTGVMLATSGPGATNLVTGIANAYMDSVPLVVITGNVSLNLIGRDSFQEVDICGITMPITKHNYIVQKADSLAEIIKEAFTIANSERPGPVLIDIPKDITAEIVDYTEAGTFSVRQTRAPAEDKLKQLAELLSKSARPLIFCGGGVVSAAACKQLRTFAEDAALPVTASLMGISSLPGDHPLMLGLMGMHGTPVANFAGERCDLLISIGTRFSDRVAGDRQRFAPNAKLVHIDIDPSEFDKNVVCDLHVTGNAKTVLERLDSLTTAQNISPSPDWLNEITHFKAKYPMPQEMDSKRANPRGILRVINEAVPKDTIIVTDVGQHQMWTAQYYPFQTPRSFITSGGLGTMGFGLGAAIGAKTAALDKTVILITGDGSFHMNLAELAASVSEELPIVVVIMNNGVLGMVRQWQRMFYDCRFSGTSINRKTDFVKLSEAFGGFGYRAETMPEFNDAFRQALRAGKTAVIDCLIDPDEKVFPMIPPGKSSNNIIYCD